MALKLLDDIRQAEENADKMVKNAQREARDVVKAAQESIIADERRANASIREEYQAVLARKRRAVDEDIRLHANEKQRAIRETVQQAEKKLPEAANAIFERVLSNGNR